MKNILVALDIDNDAQKLLDQASQMAEKFGSKVWIIHIAAPDPDFVGYEAGPRFIRDNRAEELRGEHKVLQKFAADLAKRDIASEGLLIQGPTVEMILKEAAKLRADLIIIGFHEHGFLYKAFKGSTTSEVIKNSGIPLLVVPV